MLFRSNQPLDQRGLVGVIVAVGLERQRPAIGIADGDQEDPIARRIEAGGLEIELQPVQLIELHDLFGGFQGARWVHFIAMALDVLFVAVHVAMVALAPRTLLPMFTGRAATAGHGD